MSEETALGPILDTVDHTSISRAFLDKEACTPGGRRGLWGLGGEMWRWNEAAGRWVNQSKMELEKEILEWLETCWVKKGEGWGRVLQFMEGRDVREVVWGVERMCLSPVQAVPRWIGMERAPDPDHCVAFTDVVVDVAGTARMRMAGGVGYVTMPRDDRFFGPGVLSVPFAPGVGCPTWERCQEEWSEGDAIWREVRERAYGYALMGTRKYGRGLLEQGKTQSGKGSGTNAVLSKLLVRPAYHSTNMDQIVDGFGMDGLHTCSVWVTSEVRDLDKGKGSVFATVLKMVLGGDQSSVNIKYIRQLKGVNFRCFPILQSNPMPSFPDDAGAVSSKLIILPFRNSFADPEKKDPELPGKLGAELPGIAARFVEAAVRLEIATGREKWPVVAGAAEILAQMAVDGNPFDAFLSWGFVKLAEGNVSSEYLYAKRQEFEAETGATLRRKDGKRVADSQLCFYLEIASSWKIARDVKNGMTMGIRGIGMKPFI